MKIAAFGEEVCLHILQQNPSMKVDSTGIQLIFFFKFLFCYCKSIFQERLIIHDYSLLFKRDWSVFCS